MFLPEVGENLKFKRNIHQSFGNNFLNYTFNTKICTSPLPAQGWTPIDGLQVAVGVAGRSGLGCGGGGGEPFPSLRVDSYRWAPGGSWM